MLRFLATFFSFVFLLAVAAAAGAVYVFWHYGRGLPDYHQLAHYEPPVTTRVYGGDGRLVAEYAKEKRIFVPLTAIPQRVKDAFLAAEDKDFYTHPGVDPMGVLRAMVINLRNKGLGSDRRPVGASTITQQVAKNFLLTNEVSLERKIKEAILAFRIERAFTKDHILELYLNEIYLGMGSYGVAAAALEYFDKSLDDLTTAEAAFLAALPKGPNNYNPKLHHQAAKDRRDWVIGRLLEDGKITREEYDAAIAQPLVLRKRDETQMIVGADYFAEDIRRELAAKYGESALYEGGLVVRSTVDADYQALASRVLRDGLMAYDRRHGWRGPVTHIAPGVGWQSRLAAVPLPAGAEPWELAMVLSETDQAVSVGLAGGRVGTIPWTELAWARQWLPHQHFGPPPRKAADVVRPGDVVLVEPVTVNADNNRPYPAGTYALRQIPKVEGALVALDPHTGRVLAMVGGWSYDKSQFNRASQAMRQPGSAFKPMVYLTALEHGYTPSSLVLDAPIALPQGPGLPLWRPKNYENDFLGPATLRVGVEKSRNLMTVRLAQAIGMPAIAKTAADFGVYDNLPNQLAMALGAGETTLLKLTTAYGELVNGGKKITATLIDRIQDRQGRTIYTHDKRFCDGCWPMQYTGQDMPRLPDIREQLADPVSAYQMVHIMEGVVQRGTGRVVASVGKPLAGKTGTSNDSFDTWFVGFSPDLAVGVFVGFDEPQTLGHHETGGIVAAPIFRDFMKVALAGKPPTPFRVPSGVRMVRVDLHSGKPTSPSDPNAIWEAFKSEDRLPADDEDVLDGQGADSAFTFTPLTEGAPADGQSPAGPPVPESQGGGGVPGAAPATGNAAPMPGGLY
ncbi:MAG: penicillin-binding protein 1A [Magnetospirillum sp.]|nr:penicillin-binding protein 1A [Magnetospirillum sp.]